MNIEKENYLNKLKNEMLKQKYSEDDYKKYLSYAERILKNNLPVIFDIKHLSLELDISSNKLNQIVFFNEIFYKQKKIPKRKKNEFRILDIPSMELKYIQKWILDNILKNIKVSNYAMGFKKNVSIVTNAKRHIGREYVLNLDIKDFFPSINSKRIFNIFYYYGYSKEVSFVLSKLCTYKEKLPQGSPASPMLSNIVCLKLDKRLSSLTKKFNVNYSRYADDMTFSGNRRNKNLEKLIVKILKEEGFEINAQKTRIAYSHQRQEVTGLVINDGKVRVNKKYKKKLYQEIYYCTKFGIQNHLEKINCTKSFYKEHMYGKAYFIKMVNQKEGLEILKLLDCIEWDY